MEFVNELLLSKDNISEQLILLKKHSDNKYVQEYIKSLENSEYLSGYVRYMIERYYYGKKDAIKCEKNCVEKTFKVLLRPVEIRKKVHAETDIEVGDDVAIIDGPFKGFNGKVEKVNKEYAEFIILIEVFEQKHPVQVKFEEVNKIKIS